MKNRTILNEQIFLMCIMFALVIVTGLLNDIWVFPTWYNIMVVVFSVFTIFIITAGMFTPDKMKKAFVYLQRVMAIIAVTAFLIISISDYMVYGIPYEITSYISGTSMKEVEKLINIDDGDVVLYIGRADCQDCKNFENKVDKLLEKHQVGIQGYYTNKDRNGKRSEEMYNMLDKLKVYKVPALIQIHNGNITNIDVSDLKTIEIIISNYNGEKHENLNYD